MNADWATKNAVFQPIRVLENIPDREDHRMMTIGTIPRVLSSFFRPHRRFFSKPAWPHFWGLVTAMAAGVEHSLGRLNRLLRGHTHRTNDGEFLWRSHWDEAEVLRSIALQQFRRLYRRGETIYFIIDDTQILKRGKKMEAVGKLYHHAEKRYAAGHTVFKACLYYRGVTLPWGSWLYVKKQDAARLGLSFATLTELAARAIRSLPFPPDFPVTVLFDSFYLCTNVVKAVEFKGWHYIGVAKSNRRLRVEGGERGGHRLRSYAPNVLRRSGIWTSITGLQRTHRYRVAGRTGTMKKLGKVKVVFSRRQGDGAVIALVTNDLKRSPHRVVGDYLRRWSVEMLIKDEKQNLGLGAYRVLRYRAVVRHLHLVDCAYACLTHVGLEARRAQGRTDAKNVLRLPTIRQIKEDLRQRIWNEAVQSVVKVSHERTVIRRLEKLLAA
jgi:SRSO17 transposase